MRLHDDGLFKWQNANNQVWSGATVIEVGIIQSLPYISTSPKQHQRSASLQSTGTKRPRSSPGKPRTTEHFSYILQCLTSLSLRSKSTAFILTSGMNLSKYIHPIIFNHKTCRSNSLHCFFKYLKWLPIVL